MAEDFFKEENTDTEEVTKIKVGDKEYTQDELNEKLGVADKVKELESKWSTKIDRLMPEYTKATQDRDAWKKQAEDLKKAAPKIEEKLEEAGLTEAQKKVAREQLKDIIGDEPMTKKEFESLINQRVMDVLAARDLIEATDDIVAEAKVADKPAVTRQELIDYMTETGERNPEWAYRKMFDKELRSWEAQELKKARPSPFQTISRSNAGGKTPPAPTAITKENMRDRLREVFSRE